MTRALCHGGVFQYHLKYRTGVPCSMLRISEAQHNPALLKFEFDDQARRAGFLIIRKEDLRELLR